MPLPRFSSASIQTRRLTIRPLRNTDFRAWVRSNSQQLESQNKFDPGRRPELTRTKDALIKLVRSRRELWKSDRFYGMGIFEKNSGDLIGIINLLPHARTILQSSAIGYVIFNNHWRKGFALEAAKAVTIFAFRDLGFHRLTAEIEVANSASVSLSKKLGYRREAKAKNLIYDGGAWHDCYIYATTAEEWGFKNIKPTYRVTSAEC